jgi:sugar/nucleoside kinase (ribokinase family)
MNHFNLRIVDLIVYGHVGFDISTRADLTIRTIGGAAFYVSAAARSVGARVRLVSALGGDLPQAVFEGIAFGGKVYCDQLSAEFRQSYDKNEQIVHFEASLNACDNLSPTMIGTSINRAGTIHLATAPPNQQKLALDWIRAAHFDGIVSIDTAESFVDDFRLLLLQSGDELDYIFLNSREFDALKSYLPGSATVIVKMGSQGAKIRHGQRWSKIRAIKVNTVLTNTGAGDVLAGIFMAKILQGAGEVDALAIAVSQASIFVESGLGALASAPGLKPAKVCFEAAKCLN